MSYLAPFTSTIQKYYSNTAQSFCYLFFFIIFYFLHSLRLSNLNTCLTNSTLLCPFPRSSFITIFKMNEICKKNNRLTHNGNCQVCVRNNKSQINCFGRDEQHNKKRQKIIKRTTAPRREEKMNCVI